MLSSEQEKFISLKLNDKSKFFTYAGFAGLLLMLCIDIFYLRGRIFNKEDPEITASNVLRPVVVLISVVLLILGIVSRKWIQLDALEILNKPYQRLAVLITSSFAITFLLVFVYNPNLFSYLSLEDGYIEWASVVLLSGCAIIMLVSFVFSLRRPKIYGTLKVFLGVLFLGFIFIAMEEMSWFQRIFDFETPEAFRGNWQGEMNVHNFSTLWAENIYYFGTFVFLVLLPVTFFPMQKLIEKFNLSILIPGLYVSISGAMSFAFNYTMWNTILVQISFFGSLIILLVLAKLCKDKIKRYQILIAALIMILVQATFLFNGNKLIRSWELTEYKEFFIPLAYLFYSWEVFWRVRKLSLIE